MLSEKELQAVFKPLRLVSNFRIVAAVVFSIILIFPNSFPGFTAYSDHAYKSPNPSWAPCPLDGRQSITYTSDPSAIVTVTIIRIKTIDDFDPGFILDNQQDFYGFVKIDGESSDLPQIEGIDDAYYLPPETFKKQVSSQVVPITIDIWDSDEGYDDRADINPKPGKFELDILFDLCSFQLSGDVTGESRGDITVRGSGDGDVFGGHTTEITFRISTKDMRPLSADDLAIVAVDMVQVIYDASVLIQGKRMILTVIAANNFNGHVDTSIKVTIKSSPSEAVVPEFSRIIPVSFEPRSVKRIDFLLDESFIPPVLPKPKSYFLDATVHIDPDGKLAPKDPKDCRAINDVVKEFSRKVIGTEIPKLLWSKVGKLLDVPDGFASDEQYSRSRDFGNAFIRGVFPVRSLNVIDSPIPIVPPASGLADLLLSLIHAITGIPADSLTPYLLQFELSIIGNELGYDRIMGVLRHDWFEQLEGWGGNAGLSSIEMMPNAVIFVPNNMKVPGHELGHTYGISVDSRLKGPFSWETFPVLFAWEDWDEYKLVGLMDTDHPIRMGNPASGYWLAQGGEPPELSNLLNKPVCHAHCLMGNLGLPIDKGPNWMSWATSPNMTAWIDAADYEHLIEKLNVSRDPRTIYLSGILTEGNVTLLTEWYTHETGTIDIASGTPGPYSFIFLGKNGSRLSEVGFTPSFAAPDFNGTLPFTTFGFNAELPNGTSKIQLWNRFETKMLAEREVSSHSPQVNIMLPSENQTVSSGQNLSITWKGSDPDGGNLTYILTFSDKGENWFPIARLANDNHFEWDTRYLSSGKYVLKAIVTDGVNRAESPTVSFTVT